MTFFSSEVIGALLAVAVRVATWEILPRFATAALRPSLGEMWAAPLTAL
jgi:hypothetical protein